jgi:ribonuclease R
LNDDPYAQHGFTKDALLEAIRLGEGRFTKRELAKALRLKGDQRSGLKLALRELEDGGEIRKNEQKAYELADQLPTVTVVEVIDRDVDGEFICQPVKPELQGPKIILKPGERTRGPAAGIGDKVLARLTPMTDEDGYEASVIKKLGQSAHKILCVLRDNTRGPPGWFPSTVARGMNWSPRAVKPAKPKTAIWSWCASPPSAGMAENRFDRRGHRAR